MEILLRGHPISSPVVKHNQTPKDKGPNHSSPGGEGSLEKSREQEDLQMLGAGQGVGMRHCPVERA